MSSPKPLGRLLPLLREFGLLDRKRSADGVTPLEYQRWRDLKKTLANSIPQVAAPSGRDRRQHVRVPTRILIDFRSSDELREAVISNISHGGLFINTPFAPDIGQEFMLCLRVGESTEVLDVPCEVISNNVGNGFTTDTLGMGVKFKNLDAQQREAVDRLFESALAAEDDADS
jgi:uncharacterized protein (TIGR02266 family)